MDRTGIYEFLRQRQYGVVSSISREGLPQSALVGIAVTPQLEIVFDTLRTSRKYPNLVQRPACSLVVGWDGEQTVQLEGIAFEPVGVELLRYQQTYFAAWPDGRARMNLPEMAYLVVRPRWLRFSDYDRNPPLVQEMEWTAEPAGSCEKVKVENSD